MQARHHPELACLFLAFLFALLVPSALGCGLTTHNVIAHRAQQWFSDNYPGVKPYAQLLTDPANQQAFQNGAAFPDWGYSCPLAELGYPLPDMSEATHWPPFQSAVVSHILKKYPRDGSATWSVPAQRLISFLMGVIAHSVADILWHDIAAASVTQQGYIQALGEANYYLRNAGYNSTHHGEADTGGEFMAAYELDLSFLHNTWVLPAEDLVEVFKLLKYEIPAYVIQLCNAELYAEVMAIKYGGRILYPVFADGAPFMVDFFQDYWLGGLNDMALWTSECWPNVLHGLDTGRPILFCFAEQYQQLSTELALSRQMQRDGLARKLRPYAQLVSFEQHRTSDGMVVYTNPQLKAPININSELAIKHSLAEGSVGAAECYPQTGPAAGASVTFTVPVGYSYTGKSVAKADFNGDGLQDFVIGAPGYTAPNFNNSQVGAAFIVLGNKTLAAPGHSMIDLTDPNTPALMIYGVASNARFGEAVATLDFNLDGILDLVISAPGVGFEDLSYRGAAYVYLGRRTPNLPIFIGRPDILIITSRSYTNLGYSMTTCDLDGDGHDDLVVGSPYARGQESQSTWERFIYQKGAVSVFLSSNQRHTGQTLDWMRGADWYMEGEELYDWFGSALVCHSLAEPGSGALLVVAASGASNSIKQESAYGKFYGFQFPPTASAGALSAKLVFSVAGAQKFDHLGWSVALGNPYRTSASDDRLYLAVSMPTRPVYYFLGWTMQQAGEVALLDVADLISKGNTTVDQLAPKAVIQSEQSYSRLGQFVSFEDLNGDGIDDLLVAEPHHYSLFYGPDVGALFGWTGGPDFPKGTVSSPATSASYCIRANREFALYGTRATVLDFNGDSKPDLLLCGHRDSTESHTYTGSVTLVLGS